MWIKYGKLEPSQLSKPVSELNEMFQSSMKLHKFGKVMSYESLQPAIKRFLEQMNMTIFAKLAIEKMKYMTHAEQKILAMVYKQYFQKSQNKT